MGAKGKDWTGERLGLGVVLEMTRIGRNIACVLLCDCGAKFTADLGALKNGSIKSCGCLRRARGRAMLSTHGHTGTPEHKTWIEMKYRCQTPTAPYYDRYGGRGIQVCEGWSKSFEVFLAAVGPRPSPDHSLDRINNDGNYEPGNVRWATSFQQQNNRSTTPMLTIRGETLSASEWAIRVGVPRYLIANRLRRGWDHDRCVFEPVSVAHSRAALSRKSA